jgi:hypothetical protein
MNFAPGPSFGGPLWIIGGRFLTKDLTEKYGLDLPKYQGVDQVLEIGVDAEGRYSTHCALSHFRVDKSYNVLSSLN